MEPGGFMGGNWEERQAWNYRTKQSSEKGKAEQRTESTLGRLTNHRGRQLGRLVNDRAKPAPMPILRRTTRLGEFIPRFGDRPEIRILTCRNCERSQFVTNGSHWRG
jgi:hypothetical protein